MGFLCILFPFSVFWTFLFSFICSVWMFRLFVIGGYRFSPLRVFISRNRSRSSILGWLRTNGWTRGGGTSFMSFVWRSRSTPVFASLIVLSIEWIVPYGNTFMWWFISGWFPWSFVVLMAITRFLTLLTPISCVIFLAVVSWFCFTWWLFSFAIWWAVKRIIVLSNYFLIAIGRLIAHRVFFF